MKTIKQIFLLIVAAVMALPLSAYEVDTHRQMTHAAVHKTVLMTDPWIMFSLGLLGPTEQEFAYYLRTGNVRAGTAIYSVPGLLGEGAVDEDDGVRALNHFFEPVNDRPLTAAGIVWGMRSWEWMLEQEPIDEQEHSLTDARDYLTRALTYNEGAPADAERERGFAVSGMLLSLGHVMHHMQDMAQPQHVRNDQHNTVPVISNPSRYEHYTNERRGSLLPMMESATAIWPGSADFRTKRDFWFNASNSGIAQTVNRDFLSQGTNFLMTESGAATSAFALPQPDGSIDYSVQELFGPAGLTLSSNLQAQCGNPAINCTMTMYSTTLSTRASTYSIFDQDLRATGVRIVFDAENLGFKAVSNRFFDLNRFNFDEVYDWVIRRAVSYSAGITNHFFRGRLELGPPEIGAYSAVDHSTGEGFRKMRVTVKNLTPDEALAGGSIRLIARYRRNLCYQPDLSGEFQRNAAGQSVPACANYLSPDSYVSNSLQQNVSFGVDESKQMTFTMVDPIPLDATDLILQIYYLGTVGEEADSFALGAIDISEPTYMAAMNGTDTFQLNGTFYYWRDIVANIGTAPYSAIDIDENGRYNPPNDINVTGSDMSFEIYINRMKVADAPAVPEGRFTRFALLVEPTGFEHRIIARGQQFSRENRFHFPAKILQGHYGTAVFRLRNDTLQNNATTMHAYYPYPVANVETMPKSLVENSTTPVPLQMSVGVLLGLSTQEEAASMSRTIRSNDDSTTQPAMIVQPSAAPVLPPPPVEIPDDEMKEIPAIVLPPQQ